MSEISCPECSARLKVPDERLGKKLKCPKCQAIFTAAADADEPEAEEPVSAAKAAPPSDEQSLDFGGDVDTRRTGHYKARRQLGGPAIGLMVAGAIGLVLAACGGFNAVSSGGSGAYKAGSLAGVVVTSIWSIVVLVGANSMRGSGRYTGILICCIFAMLPCSFAWLLALPMAIWALVVLNREDVRKAVG